MCGKNHTPFKSWMSYKKITNKASKQYKLIHSDKIKVGKDGLLYCGEYVGVALGSRYGKIGDKFVLTTDKGNKIKAVKIDEKANSHTYKNCHHLSDGSMVEFVIDVNKAKKSYPNAIKMGDFNHEKKFNGKITQVERIVEQSAERG